MRAVKLKMKIMAVSTIGAFFLSACSGGSSGPENNETLITKDIPMCTANNPTVLKKDDKVIALTNDTEVRVIHKQDATKTVCVVTGQATVTTAL